MFNVTFISDTSIHGSMKDKYTYIDQKPISLSGVVAEPFDFTCIIIVLSFFKISFLSLQIIYIIHDSQYCK